MPTQLIPTAEQFAGLNVALNEARILTLDFDLIRRAATVRFGILTLPPEGPPPPNAEIELSVFPLCRVAASLRRTDGPIVPLRLEQLSDVVEQFAGRAIYGWEFFDPPPANLADWVGQLSLDISMRPADCTHMLHLFQDRDVERFDLCLWFNELTVHSSDGLSLDTFIADGKRWWDGVFAGDPRTAGAGIQPLRKK